MLIEKLALNYVAQSRMKEVVEDRRKRQQEMRDILMVCDSLYHETMKPGGSRFERRY